MLQGLLTEQDWANLAQLENRPKEYKETLLIWADWAEENELGYERGLREMAETQRKPNAESWGRPDREVWRFYWEENAGKPDMINYSVFLPPAVFKKTKDTHHLGFRVYFDSFLEAMFTAARAYQEVGSPSGIWTPRVPQ